MNTRSDPASPGQRIAVIAVHGVADQKAGDTARAVAGLLLATHPPGAPGVRYRRGDCDSVMLPVEPLAPMPAVLAKAAPVPATPVARPIRKALPQSVRSDFQRADWVVPDTPGAPAAPPAPAVPAAPTAPAPKPPDAGIAFSEYLLFKAARNDAPSEPHEFSRVRLLRGSGAQQHQVDVHEMYWADLSRLSGAIPRILTELFTMVFRLSRLGRDTVDQAAQAARAAPPPPHGPRASWTWLARAQIALDWAFASLLANLFLQLLLAGCVLVAMGVASPYAAPLAKSIAVAAPLLALLWVAYRFGLTLWRGLAAVAGAIACGLALTLLPGPWLVGLAWLGLLTLACDYLLRVADERFPTARLSGMTMWAVTALLIVYSVFADGASADLQPWVRAAMLAVEIILRTVVWWWALAVLLLLVWLGLGWRVAAKGTAAERASVATGRLGLFVSIAAFLTLTMALWALLATVLELGAGKTPYEPVIFTNPQSPAAFAAEAPAWCSVPETWRQAAAEFRPTAGSGARFIDGRYRNSTETFALVAFLVLLMALYVIAVALPSVLAERKANIGTGDRLGRWLTVGLRGLDRVTATIVFSSVALACVVALFLLTGVPQGGWARGAASCLAIVSWIALKPLVFTAAGVAGALTAFGGVLSRYVPGLRAPLDLALDVDNHFREFPRKAIPRARIFARYVALLEHLAAEGYDRVVIVAHSQGTVLSAELLRYLQWRARQAAPGNTRVAPLWKFLAPRVHLLTAGCPLRQLYAARFPELYGWVLQAHGARAGPVAGDVGAQRWVNVYTTGDYVGRWLWSDPPPPPPPPPTSVDPLADKPEFYNSMSAADAVADVVGGATELDVCLGSGAHTHYFEPDQKTLAQLIDTLATH